MLVSWGSELPSSAGDSHGHTQMCLGDGASLGLSLGPE